MGTSTISSPSAVRRTPARAVPKFLAGVLAFLVAPSLALSDFVVTTDEVTTSAVIRQSASSQSAPVGALHPGEQAELSGSVPRWYNITLNGTSGFVSKRLTRIVPSAPASGTTGTGTYTMDVVDVGTGLGILVRGSDFTLVYDAGSNDDQALGSGNRMLAFIKAVVPTLTTIDQMILSHPHTDHVLLMADLLQAYQVRQVWDSGRINDVCGYHAFIAAIRDEPGVQYHNALRGSGTQDFTFTSKPTCSSLPAETITLPLAPIISTEAPVTLGQNASMTFLHADGGNHSNDYNANSLVVRLDLGNTRVLLMGDAEAGSRDNPSVAPTPGSVEGQLLACCSADLSARVMVVGHHGSMSSSRRALLDAVGASVYIVSSGPKKYGSVVLPDQVVINELTTRGQVFRTDLNDTACETNPAKIGPDADGQPGGCDNIRVVMSDSNPLQVSVWHGSD